MRFDNPINNHWFQLTDIADFPELKNEWRLQDPCEQEIKQMEEAVSTNNYSSFTDALNKILAKSKDIEFLSKEHKYAQKWRGEKLPGYFKHSCTYGRRSKIVKDNPVFNDFFEKGVHACSIDTTSLTKKLQKNIDGLINMKITNQRVDRYDRMMGCDNETINMVSGIFKKKNILSAASNYNGRNLSVVNVVLLVSKPNDVHYRGFMLDCKEEPETICYHIDPKEDVMKAMIYLNDIDDQAGPFSYVPTSNRFMINKLQQIFGRSITTGSYCHTPDARRSVFRLPKRLRVSYNFGRLLLDNTDLSNKILKEHEVYTSDKANCVAFDPGAGIHRGAFCKSKNRVALQVLMK